MFVVVAAATLCSCAVLMTPPARPSSGKITGGLTYVDGYNYLVLARDEMQRDVDTLERLDGATKGMVGLGVGGAGIAALFKGGADSILGLLALGGLGYTGNQAIQPLVRVGIFRAGLKNLDCIDDAAADLNGRTGGAREQLKGVQKRMRATLDQLFAATQQARADTVKGPPEMSKVMMAESAYQSAEALSAKVDAFISETAVGRAIYSAVNRTVATVSEQLDSKSPSIDAIAQTGSMFSAFVSSHQAVAMQAKTDTQKALDGVVRVDQAGIPEWLTKLQSSLETLNQEVSEIQVLLASQATSTTGISECKAVAPGSEPMVLDPPDPVRLPAGGLSYNLIVKGDRTGKPKVGWVKQEPTAKQLVATQTRDGSLQVFAPADADPNVYMLYLYDSSSNDDTHRASNRIEITVVAAVPVPVFEPVPGSQPHPRPQVGKGKDLAASAPLTGLGLRPEVGAKDQVYVARVKKLEDCAKLPETGKLNAALLGYLANRKSVDSNGTCPALKAALVPSAPAASASPKASQPAAGASSPLEGIVPRPPKG